MLPQQMNTICILYATHAKEWPCVQVVKRKSRRLWTEYKQNMSKKITILGCGYLGEKLASSCLSMGWEVFAFTRNEGTASTLSKLGVQHVVTGRLEERSWHDQIDRDQDYVVNCVGAAAPSLDGYRQSYLQGMESVREWLSSQKDFTFVFTSSTSVYPQSQGELVDEASSHESVSERGQVLLEAEKVCMSQNKENRKCFVLRLAGLYGPGRHLLIDKVKAGEALKGRGGRILNLTHRDDAVGAILDVLRKGHLLPQGKIYNVSDNEWAKRREIVEWIAGHLSLEVPAFDNLEREGTPNRKVSSHLIREEIGWAPVYNSFKEAYQEMLAS